MEVSDQRARLVEEVKDVQIGPLPTQKTKIGTTLSQEAENGLVEFLRHNTDVFAWSTSDMPGVDPDFICHRLSLDPKAKPIAQRKRRFSEDKRKAISEETKRLVDSNFVREIEYPTWLANVVMVRKASGKWRMCTDFTDLNKACPKDSYPLPNIDDLVDGASGYRILSLLDAYSGYNQIRMHPLDEDKTAFMTDNPNYCYKAMPFGLKNAGATYQRMMDRIFKKQAGRNIEVYVDDMVVKSNHDDLHQRDLQETFDTIRGYDLKLNPEKCSFGIQAGKYLGFMLTSRGIEVNPEKCKAIIQMQSPSNVKEVQQLTGRVSSLSRFMSKSADRALPFFKCLKKNDKFQWTVECEETFARLKEFLTTPPILCRPTLGIVRNSVCKLPYARFM